MDIGKFFTFRFSLLTKKSYLCSRFHEMGARNSNLVFIINIKDLKIYGNKNQTAARWP
jgi:hypothetical protein